MDCRNLRSAWIMASSTGDDGSIDTTTARRPDVALSYLVHSVKINGEYISMHLPVCGGMKLTKTEDILAKLFRFGRMVNIYPLDPPCLCRLRE